jgi:GT2 family glycosyltransferase
MNDTTVAVVILNFNGRHFLEKFLPNVILNSSGHQVYLADNASTDDSVTYTQSNFKNVTVIRNAENYGYARGYNEALKKISATYYILVNSDVEVASNWIEPLKKLMDHDSGIAACQPKIIDYNQKQLFEYAGAAGGFIDKLGYPFCRGRLFNSIEKDEKQFDDTVEVFWATGACLMVRSESFWKAGGMDDDYFAHMEEIDLCWRLKNLGFKIFSVGSSSVYHIGGGTLDKYSSKKTFLNFRNNLTTLTKNHPPGTLLFKILIRLFLDGIAGIKFLLEGQPSHCIAVIKAHWAYYSRIPSILKKRRTLQNASGFRYSIKGMYRGNIVIEYFINKKRKFKDLHKGFF